MQYDFVVCLNFSFYAALKQYILITKTSWLVLYMDTFCLLLGFYEIRVY